MGVGLELALRRTFSLLIVFRDFGRSLEAVVMGVRSESLLEVNRDDRELARVLSFKPVTCLRELSERLGVYPDPKRADPAAAVDVTDGRSISFVGVS